MDSMWVENQHYNTMHHSISHFFVDPQAQLVSNAFVQAEEAITDLAAPYDCAGFHLLQNSCRISPKENYMDLINNGVISISQKPMPDLHRGQSSDFSLSENIHHQQYNNDMFNANVPSLPPFIISNEDCSSTALLSRLNSTSSLAMGESNNNDNNNNNNNNNINNHQPQVMCFDKSSLKCVREKVSHRNKSQRESHILAERQRREEMNEKFSILKSLIPNLTKKDKASIVTETINYLVELEKKAENLKAVKESRKRPCKIRKKNSPGEEVPIVIVDNFTERRLDDTYVDKKQLFTVNTASSEQSGTDKSEEGKTCTHIEVQNLGSQAVIKILCRRSQGLVLRTHSALNQCQVDVLQSNVTTIGENVVHYFTVQLNPGVSSSVDDLIIALQQASNL